MGRAPWFFPLPLTIVTATLTYGVFLPIHQWVTGSDVVVSVLQIVLCAFVLVVAYRFFAHISRTYTTFQTKMYGWVDGYISVIHGIAGLSMALYLLDGTSYANIPPGSRGYDLYWTYMLTNILFLFNTVGRGNTGGINALGVVPGLMASVIGLVYISVFLAVFVTRFYNIPNKPREPDTRVVYSGTQKNRRGPRRGRGAPLI